MNPPIPADAILLSPGYYWQQLQVGQRFATLRRTVTETDLIGFIGVTGMLEAIFVDAAFEGAAIKGRAVPAALTYSLIEGMIFQTMIQGTGLAMLELQQKVLAPVLVGDTISALITIDSIRPTSKNNRAIVVSTIEVFKQDGTAVQRYTATRMLAGR